jgi:hypothetical protein
MSWVVYGTIFSTTAGFGASLTVKGGFLNAATSSLKRVTGTDFTWQGKKKSL